MSKPQVLAVQCGDIGLLLPFFFLTTTEAISDDKQTRELSIMKKTIEADVIALVSIFPNFHKPKVTCPRTSSDRIRYSRLWGLGGTLQRWGIALYIPEKLPAPP